MDTENKDGQESGWSFHPEDASEATAPLAPAKHLESISWTGSEFIEQHKNAGWYLGLAGFIALACGITYFVSKKDLLPVVFIGIMGVLFAIIASRKPRQLQYSIDESGLTIGSNHHPFGLFKSFSAGHDGAIGYVSLLPLQRFKPELFIYFAPDDEDKIFDALATYLPHEDRKETVIDRLAKHIRF